MQIGKETQRELRFISSLGSNSTKGQEGGVTKTELLRGYITAYPKRVSWAWIDKHVVLHHAFEELQLCM